MVNFFCRKVEVDTISKMWYNMVNREHGGVTMAEKQPSENIYMLGEKGGDRSNSTRIVQMERGKYHRS